MPAPSRKQVMLRHHRPASAAKETGLARRLGRALETRIALPLFALPLFALLPLRAHGRLRAGDAACSQLARQA
jgi:hypothetical protein